MKKKSIIKNKSNSGSLLRGIVFILALASILGLVWLVFQYQKDNQKINVAKETVDKQMVLSSQFYLDYLHVLQGKTTTTNEIQNKIASFDNNLKNIQTGNNIPAPTSGQQKILTQLTRNWRDVKAPLSQFATQNTNIEQTIAKARNISTLVSEIDLTAGRISDSIDHFQSNTNIDSTLESVPAVAISLDKLMQNILFGNKEATLVAQLADKTQRLASINNDLENELKNNNQLIFLNADGAKQYKTLIENNQQVLTALGTITKTLPDYLAANQEISHISDKTGQMTNELMNLKSNYSIEEALPVSFLSFNYAQLIIGLAILSILFLGLWILMVILNSQRLRKEADKLRVEAENRTSRDQDAILRLMDDMGGLSEGDLTIEAQVTEDFTGAVADSVNFAVENMREMVGTIIHSSDEISRATENTKNISRVLSDSSKEQSRQITTANQTANRMANSLNEIAENTDASVDIARSSVDIAQEGRSRVLSTIKSMTDIRENIQDTAKRIKRLGESSQEIGDIVEIIKSIADQTNVLALNAAIQATAAGEAGRGFAVVADEVQRLAERSANATKRIEVLVKTIQADANEAVASMENSTTQVVAGTSVAEEAGHSLDQIENVSQNLANLIINVSRATKNAAGMAGNVAKGMDKLSALNQESVKDVSTSVQSIDNLGELSISLKESVSGFKLPTS